MKHALRHITLILLIVMSGCTGVLSRDGDGPGLEVERTAQRELGHDLLGAQQPNFDYKSAAQFIPTASPLGFLDHTFGNSIAPIRYLITNIRPRFVRVHFLNTVCVRNRNCGRYEPVAGYSISSLDKAIQKKDPKVINHLIDRVNVWKKLAQENPGTFFLVSPALEHNMQKQSWRVLADVILTTWPGVQLVNNGMGGVSVEEYRGAWVERHGKNDAGDQINSLDGEDITDIKVPAWLKKTRKNIITFRWSRVYNCRDQKKDKNHNHIFTDPRKRKAACPKPRDFDQIEHATDNEYKRPKQQFTCSTKKFDNNSIWKPMGEDFGNGDSRINLPVLITNLGRNTVYLVDFKGNRVGTLGYYGTFEGGKFRYYSGYRGGSKLSGYEFQKEAMRLSGNPYVWAKTGNKCVGPFIPGRRGGSYR